MQASEIPLRTRTDRFQKRLKQRRRADNAFRYIGLGAVGISLFLLFVLLASIFFEARSAFTRHLLISTSEASSETPEALYRDVRQTMLDLIGSPEARDDRLQVSRLISQLAVSDVPQDGGVADGESKRVEIALSDDADLYLKGVLFDVKRRAVSTERLSDTELSGDFSGIIALLSDWRREELNRFERQELRSAFREVQLLEREVEDNPSDAQLTQRYEAALERYKRLEAERDRIATEIETGQLRLTILDPALLVRTSNGYGRVTQLATERVTFEPMISGLTTRSSTQFELVRAPVARRSITDLQIAVLNELKRKEMIEQRLNLNLLSSADSSEAELAGLLGGLIGSVLLMLVTMLLALPVGIAAAIYLEEFAPRNAFTKFVQININNLAAVPSIVFGLLGAAILVNGVSLDLPFIGQTLKLGGGLGRGWPLVGGLVLALMTLPTIVISSRAALASVPNSVRQGALAIGASRLQMIQHHVLPIAGPGILTGSIIGLAQALGETAPLLLIGMVAFLGDLPDGVTDRATALPVLIFQWSTRAERAWEPLTSAAIMILLGLMLLLNGLAVWLRMRYDKK